MRVLICGLPGSGKTFFARLLASRINSVWFNADVVREQFNDWNFDTVSRSRQARRMKGLANVATAEGRVAICDFVAPTDSLRAEFNADFTVFVNTIKSGRFDDTNQVFEIPSNADYVVRSHQFVSNDVHAVVNAINKTHNQNQYLEP